MLKNIFILTIALVLGAGCSQSAKLNRHLERAQAASQKGDFETARLEFLNVLQLSPEHPEALAQLGFIYFDRGEIIPAAQLLNKAKELQPTNIAIRVKLGTIFTAIGRFTNALEEAEYALLREPAHGGAAILLANSTARPQLPALEQRLGPLVAANPGNSELHLALGIVQDRSGNDSAAEASYKKAHSLEAKNAKPAFALGNLYWGAGRTNEAAAYLKAAAKLAPIRSVERLRYAEFQLRNGQPEDGKKILEETIAKAADFIPALTALSEIYLIERRTNECSINLQKVLKIDPQNAPALLLRSRLKQVSGDSAGAVDDLEQIVRDNPNHQAALYELAMLHRARNDHARALNAVERALSTRTNFVQGILLRSELLAAGGDFAAAIPPLLRLTNQVPDNPTAYFLLASALRGRGTPDDALIVYRQMSEKFPKDPQPHHFSGITLRQQKRFPEARQAYARALQVQTNYLPAIDDLIELDILSTNYTAAFDRAQTYIDLYPDKPMPRLLQAKIFVGQKKWVEAEAALKKAIELAPEFILAHRSLATLYITSDQTGQAIEKLKSIIVSNPRDAGSMLQLGMLYEANKQFTAARETYEKLLQVQPNAVYALNNLAYVLSEEFQENDKAWLVVQKARAQDPSDPYLADTFGWIAFKRGDYSRALPVLQHAADRLPDKPEVSYHLGMAYYMTGQQEPAASALAAAVNSNADFRGKEQARAALAILRFDPATAKPEDRKLISEMLARNPADVFALIRLGQLHQRDKNWTQAAGVYEAALKASPRSQVILLELATIKVERLGKPGEALAHAREVWNLSQDPSVAAAAGRIGVVAGDTRWALPLLQLAARSPSVTPEVHYHLARAAYAQGDLALASESLGRAGGGTISFPEKSKAVQFATIVRFHLGQATAADASAAANSLLQSDTAFPPGLIASGLVLEGQGKFSEARQMYETVLQTVPEHLLAQRQLAILLADKLSDDSGAASLASKVRSQSPDDALMANLLGKIAFRRGEFREAVSLLGTAAARLPRNADTLYHLGLAEFRLKQSNARHSLTQALSLDPGAKLAADARKALSELN